MQFHNEIKANFRKSGLNQRTTLHLSSDDDDDDEKPPIINTKNY